MKHTKQNKHRRAKVAGIAAAALVAGIGLLVLSRMVAASGQKAAASAATQPAVAQTAPAGSPAPGGPLNPDVPARRAPLSPLQRKALNDQRMAGLLLLFSLMCLGLVGICVGWIVYDIRRSRPAWMTQTKYPVRTPRK